MNIKSKNGNIIHIQKSKHRTICGRSIVIRLFNRMNGLFEYHPYYIEVEEEVTCEKCKKQMK